MRRAKLAEIQPGDKVIFDGGFECVPSNSVRTVHEDKGGKYVDCTKGKHYLASQLGLDDELVGVYEVQS